MYIIEIIFRPSDCPYNVTPVRVKRAVMEALTTLGSKSLATSFARFHLYAFYNIRFDLSFLILLHLIRGLSFTQYLKLSQ